jgi:hypothetical protein
MTPSQTIFDRAARHLLSQGRRGANLFVHEGATYGEPRFHAKDGTKCAVGALISEEHYDPWIEGCQANKENIRARVALSLGLELDEVDGELLKTLQHVHDMSYPEGWHARLRVVAALFGLEATVLEEVTP